MSIETIEFELGEYDVRIYKERETIELQNGTYKYMDLSFKEFKELCHKIKEALK